MSKKDLDKETLYTAVKSLVECDAPHIHLCQQKLFTLFSVAFQYMLFQSTKNPGIYILRIEDSFLAEKLARKSKDQITRRFLQKIYLPRRAKYEQSQFYLDFFNFQSWSITNDLPKEKIKGAIIVKNTQDAPLHTMHMTDSDIEDHNPTPEGIPEDLFLTSLTSFVPKTITIAYNQNYDGLEEYRFDFIKDEGERLASGVRISGDIDLGNLDD